MYLDLLIILNLLLNYFLLLLTAKMFRHRTGLWRLAGGALLGVPAVLAALWPVNSLLTLAVLVLAPLVMVMAAFWPVRRVELLLLWGGFFLVSFMTGGAVLAAGQLFTPAAKPAVMGDALLLAAACLLLYLLLGCLKPYMEEKKWQRLWEVELTITWRDRQKTVTAFLDTGNRLRDPVGRRPVIIVDFRSLNGLLPAPVYLRLADPEADLWKVMEEMSDYVLSGDFTLIPFRGVGGSREMMLGFRPDTVTVSRGGRIRLLGSQVVLGLNRLGFGPVAKYQALLPPDLLPAG